MSNDQFEVAFSGEIAEGEDLEQVKARVAQMFKADAAKLANLFSGQRVVIKKNIDQQTAIKYRVALNKAGALCEVKNITAVASLPVKEAQHGELSSAVTSSKLSESGNIKITAPDISVDIPRAPDTDPLHITADEIEELSITIAEVGSDMQVGAKQVAAPELDISGLDMLPPGSALLESKVKEAPPLPDTEGLKIID